MQIAGIDRANHQMLRKRLVEEVRHKGITDEGVLESIEVIPRHFFIDAKYRYFAYFDQPIPIGEGQTISQPYTVAYQTQLLRVSSSDKILEIGTGSAYQACILAWMGAQVFTIERQKKLFDKYQQSPYLQEFKNIRFFYGDGHDGLPEFSPFDKILITAATPLVPHALLNQLKPQGSLVLPLGVAEESQVMVRITKAGDGSLIKEAFNQFNFVPMLQGTKE